MVGTYNKQGMMSNILVMKHGEIIYLKVRESDREKQNTTKLHVCIWVV